MACPHSESFDVIDLLEEAARRGDWQAARAQAESLATPAEPVSGEEIVRLAEYLDRLRSAVVTVRASRAQAIALLRRVNAAASFRGASE